MSKSDDRAKLAAARLRGFFGNGPAVEWPEMTKAMKKLQAIGAKCCGQTMAVGYRCEGCPHATPGDKLVPRRSDFDANAPE